VNRRRFLSQPLVPVKSICFALITLVVSTLSLGQSLPRFEDAFEDKTLRIDYYHTANADEDIVCVDQMYVSGAWAGNPRQLAPASENGRSTITVFDAQTNERLYSNYMLTIVFEYKGIEEAQKGIHRTFHQTVRIPCPKRPVRVVLESRDLDNRLHPIFERVIDPNSVAIKKEQPSSRDRRVGVLCNGPPHDKVDLAFISEGYRGCEFEKFKKDVQHYVDYLFSVTPFRENKSRFNVWAVFRASAESGVDIPTKGIFKNTVLSASYNTLGQARYCTIFDNKTMRDVAGAVPYDHVIALANTSEYGGGGFANDYCLFTSDDKRSEEIFTHEFGHSFAGLADEYISDKLFPMYYKRGVEPLEPNITAWLKPDQVKWAHLLTPDIPLPTPAQDEFDGKVGLFEGAGYAKTGMYRSCLHCVMGAGGREYCQACQEAIQAVIDHQSNP